VKSFRSLLQSGQPQIGLCVMYPSPGVVERIGADWDWIWIDGQHGELAYTDIISLVRACDLIQRPAFVRVPGHEFGLIGLALDTAPAGLIVPCVDTVEQARAVVRAAKFPPLGGRSYGGRRPIDRVGRTYSDNANHETLLICQIESPEATENADSIAAVDGVDALFLGPDDVMLRRGFSMTTPRSKDTLGKDFEAVITACRNHGKFGVSVGIGKEMLGLCLALGYHLIVAGGDVPFLANGSRQAATEARELIKGYQPSDSQPSPAGPASPY
jgi:4-hydroxy-2-oxoheptanedioate aldolase